MPATRSAGCCPPWSRRSRGSARERRRQDRELSRRGGPALQEQAEERRAAARQQREQREQAEVLAQQQEEAEQERQDAERRAERAARAAAEPRQGRRGRGRCRRRADRGYGNLRRPARRRARPKRAAKWPRRRGPLRPGEDRPVLLGHDAGREGAQPNRGLTTRETNAPAQALRPAPQNEEVIPLAEEVLVVGKQTVNTGTTRIRRYVVEIPVEQQVSLVRERVVVERRRPVTNNLPARR